MRIHIVFERIHTLVCVSQRTPSLMNLAVLYVVSSYLFISMTAAGAPIPRKYYKDESFDEKFVVNNRTITCSRQNQSSMYLSPMWKCHNISVDGIKLFHGYIQDKKNDFCNDCPCGSYNSRPNDVHALCKAMLAAHHVTEPLLAAYVMNPSCMLEDLQHSKRMKYYLNENNVAVWESVTASNGYVNTLQCSTREPSPAYRS